ncbi:hypothetical protein [Streptomyces sp. NBC_00557]|uniref:hypothetical protein n=1 Tax=Streptomyces sp. NBC_00557 TaxID=2975776 RepID=UPI002E7FE9A9|nr:hypothetical protein [Streptomyces sp. NBC_00557]WUC36324.1 hypothetical protein OG956_19940 [Streptomyces sp. NBC_00557]
MSDVYVPERGDRYHLYKDCADLGFGQLGNTAQGLGTHNVAPMPLDQAEALKKTLCRTCRKTAALRP